MRYRSLFCANAVSKGRLVSKRRVQAFLVVDVGNEAIDAAAGVVEIDEGLAVDLLGLKRNVRPLDRITVKRLSSCCRTQQYKTKRNETFHRIPALHCEPLPEYLVLDCDLGE